MKVQGYAQHTGKRLFVTPAIFEAGFSSRFTRENRQHPIYFDYPWSETDIVNIQLPDGYHLDHGDAVAQESYFNGGRKVKQLRAWLVAPNGFVKVFDKNSMADIGVFDQMELYNDIRVRSIRAEDPEIGSVFAYESQVEDKPLFAQDDYQFQNNLPAVRSRYILTLPSGWNATSVVFNHEAIQPVIDGSTYTWELKELPFHEHEEHSPSMFGLVPRLAVDFHPPSNTPLAAICFNSWTDVSRWHGQLAAGQDQVTPEIADKVRELVSSAPSEYAKIQAIGRYVQKIKYVAIEMDQAHGGGYKPHAAAVVFRKQYGTARIRQISCAPC